jgi:hypothetical protein
VPHVIYHVFVSGRIWSYTCHVLEHHCTHREFRYCRRGNPFSFLWADPPIRIVEMVRFRSAIPAFRII